MLSEDCYAIRLPANRFSYPLMLYSLLYLVRQGLLAGIQILQKLLRQIVMFVL